MHDSLSAHDTSAVLDAIEQLAGATESADFMDRALTLLQTLVPGDSSSFNWVSEGRVHAIVRPALTSEEWDRYAPIMAEFSSENPLVQHFRRTGDMRALTWDDVADDDSWKAGTLYQTFYRPLGVTHQLGVRLPSPPHVVAGLVVNRSSGFDQRDADLLTVLGRHVVARMDAVAEHAALRSAFDQRGWRTIQVDDDGRPLGPIAPDLADLVLDAEGALHVGLSDMVVDRVPPSPGRPFVPGEAREIELPSGRVVAFVAPGPMPPQLLFVHQVAERPLRLPPDALLATGLSAREAEVAAQLVLGSTNRQIANDLFISVGTVKKHLERIYDVLGVDNRAAAASTVVRLLG